MIDREKVIKAIENNLAENYEQRGCETCPYNDDCHGCATAWKADALALLKEQGNLLGMKQTATGITFLSTGTAQQGEERGILLGKSLMHEWIYKELLRKGLLTDDIRSVFEQAKRI